MADQKDSDGIVMGRVRFIELDPEKIARAANGGISSLIAALMGVEEKAGYNFGSAHFLYDSLDKIPQAEKNSIAQVMHAVRREGGDALRRAEDLTQKYPTRYEAVRDILARETTTDLERFDLAAIRGFQTRELMGKVLGFALKGREVALPLPNWHFWEDECGVGNVPFAYFNGRDESEIVRNFRRTARKGKAGALILVDPANPLCYRITEPAAREIDEIALKYGIEVIVDDVLRGTMPIGQRDSIARWFTSPWVVEGFGKRFGDGPFSKMGYVLVPKSSARIPPEADPVSRIDGQMIRLAYTHATEPAVQELRERNKLFDRTLRERCPEVQVTRPFDSSLVSRVEIPRGYKTSATDFQKRALEYGVDAYTIDEFYPRDYKSVREMPTSLRITTGRLRGEELEKGTSLIADILNKGRPQK